MLSGENRKISSVKCIQTKIIDGKAIDIPNTEFSYNANSIVFAIGLKPNREVLEKEGLTYNEKGLINVNENYQTNIDKVFAGGDLTESKSTVCRAIASSRKAAKSIIKMLEK